MVFAGCCGEEEGCEGVARMERWGARRRIGEWACGRAKRVEERLQNVAFDASRSHGRGERVSTSARRGRGERTLGEKRAWRPLFGSLTAAKAAPTCLYVFWMRLFGKNSEIVRPDLLFMCREAAQMAAAGELTAEAPATAGKLRRGDAEKKIGHRWGTEFTQMEWMRESADG